MEEVMGAVADGTADEAARDCLGRDCLVRRLGRVEYGPTRDAMRSFTAARDAAARDELWLLEHEPVYTLGQGAPETHGPRIDSGIPLVKAERGGDVTYHGPGQLVLYALVDIGRRRISVKRFVQLLEQSVIDLLADLGIQGARKPGAPGVYVEGEKIAALGIRVARGRTYHGLALNVDMDLAPFEAIDPCGDAALKVTQLRALGVRQSLESVGTRLAAILQEHLTRG